MSANLNITDSTLSTTLSRRTPPTWPCSIPGSESSSDFPASPRVRETSASASEIREILKQYLKYLLYLDRSISKYIEKLLSTVKMQYYLLHFIGPWNYTLYKLFI